MRIRWNYLFIIWGVTLLPLAVGGYLVHRASLQRTEREAGSSLRLLTKLVGGELDQYIGTLRERIRARTGFADFTKAMAPATDQERLVLEQTLLGFHNIDPVNISSVALLDGMGKKVSDSDATLSSVDEQGMPWVLETFQKSQGVVVAEATSAKPSVWITVPVRSGTGAIVGIVRVRMQLSALQQIVGRATSDLNTFAVLADENGVVLAHGQNTDAIGTSLITPFPKTTTQSELAPDGRKILRGEDSDWRYAFMNLSNGDWSVAVFQSREAFASGSNEIARVILILGGLAIVVGGIAALVASRLMTRPITQLATIAKRIEEGAENVQFDASGPQELVQLGEAFNRMTKRLHNSYHDLEKQIEETRENERRLRDVINANPIALAVADDAGFIVRLNPAFSLLLGYALSEIPTVEDLWKRLFPEPEIHARFKEEFARYLQPGSSPAREGNAMEIEIPAKNGSRKVVELRARLFGPMLIVAFHDLTARRKAELEVVRLNVDLEQRVASRTLELTQANAELESFSYAVSHDLRAPLRAIDGFSRALQEDYAPKLDGDALDYLNRIRAASQRMGLLIDDLLTLSKVSRAEVHRERFDLADVAQSVWDSLRQAEPEREIKFVCKGPMPVEADLSLIRIVMENLLSNAWKYTRRRPNATVSFTESQQAAPVGREERVFILADNGAGFDMRYAGKLFGAFQRLHSVAEFEGTGIGLATVRRIVNRHGGRIWAQAEVNVGATFLFTLSEAKATPLGKTSDSHSPFTLTPPRPWH